MKPAVEKVVEAARALGLEIEVRHFPEGTRTAQDAARAIGCDVAQIVKSLVFMADGDAVIAYVSGANRLDEERLARAAHAKDVRRASPEQAREATGFAIGGTPPFGHARPLRLFLDETLLLHDVVWAAAGTPDTVFALEPDRLMALTGATVAKLAEGA